MCCFLLELCFLQMFTKLCLFYVLAVVILLNVYCLVYLFVHLGWDLQPYWTSLVPVLSLFLYWHVFKVSKPFRFFYRLLWEHIYSLIEITSFEKGNWWRVFSFLDWDLFVRLWYLSFLRYCYSWRFGYLNRLPNETAFRSI